MGRACFYFAWPLRHPIYFPLFTRRSGQGSASSTTQSRPILRAVWKLPRPAACRAIAGFFPWRLAYSVRGINIYPSPFLYLHAPVRGGLQLSVRSR